MFSTARNEQQARDIGDVLFVTSSDEQQSKLSLIDFGPSLGDVARFNSTRTCST